MTLDDQLRDSLERTAELMPAPSGLDARALRSGQRLQHRRRSAVATAGAGVLTAAALGGYAALPNGGGRPSAVAAQSSIPADQLSDVLTRMAAQPDPGATAPFWYIRTSQHYLFDGTEHDGSRQEWYGRTGDGRRVSSDGSVLPMGEAGFAPLGPGAPIDWDQLDALPTSPDALAAVIAQGAAAIAATPVRDQPSPHGSGGDSRRAEQPALRPTVLACAAGGGHHPARPSSGRGGVPRRHGRNGEERPVGHLPAARRAGEHHRRQDHRPAARIVSHATERDRQPDNDAGLGAGGQRHHGPDGRLSRRDPPLLLRLRAGGDRQSVVAASAALRTPRRPSCTTTDTARRTRGRPTTTRHPHRCDTARERMPA